MERIQSLDALRAVAALSVFFFHIKVLARDRLGDFMWFGWVGVELFFVLSGFFIGVAVLAPSQWNPLEFMRRRFRRIVPAYYVSLFITVILVNSWFLVHRTGWVIIAKHLAFSHTFFGDSHGSINGAYWTLGIEAYFYLLMVLTAPLLRSRWRPAVLIVWLVVCYAWRAWIFWFGPADANHRFFLGTQLPGMLDLFVIGVGVAWVVTKTNWLKRAETHFQWLALLFLGPGILLFGLCIQQLQNLTGHFWFDSYAAIAWRTMLGLSFAAMIAALILLDHSPLFRKIIKRSGIAYLGRISYSIYLYHIPVILSLHHAEVPGLPTTDWKMALMMTAITLGVAMLSYHLVEEPYYRSKAV